MATQAKRKVIEHPIQIRLTAMSMARGKKRLTQKWLAGQSRLNESVISAYIHKRLILMPNTLHAIRIRKALGIDADYQLAMGQEYWRDYRMDDTPEPLKIKKAGKKLSETKGNT